MKKGFAYGLIVFAVITGLFFMNSCEEIGPVIELKGLNIDTSQTSADTSYVLSQVEIPQDKTILIEEFTGVRCTNCPKAHDLIDNLRQQHGNRVLAISIHSKQQSAPYGAEQDLNIQLADDLESFLGPIPGKPTGTVDRKEFPSESELIVFTTKWAGYVSQQLSQTTPVNINIVPVYNDTTRSIAIKITLHYTADVLEANRLTVFLLEDGILTSQLDDGHVEAGYEQNQVLRKAFTQTTGTTLASSFEPGRVYEKNFGIDSLSTNWNINNLKVLALVHKSVGSKEVLHALEVPLVP